MTGSLPLSSAVPFQRSGPAVSRRRPAGPALAARRAWVPGAWRRWADQPTLPVAPEPTRRSSFSLTNHRVPRPRAAEPAVVIPAAVAMYGPPALSPTQVLEEVLDVGGALPESVPPILEPRHARTPQHARVHRFHLPHPHLPHPHLPRRLSRLSGSRASSSSR